MLHDNIIDIKNNRFAGHKLADVIEEIASDASRLHKEGILEKMLVTANLGSAGAEAFYYNIYLACNPFFVPPLFSLPSWGRASNASPRTTLTPANLSPLSELRRDFPPGSG